MKFASIRLVTAQFEPLLAFYQKISGIDPVRLADGFAEVRFDGAVLAISSQALVARFNADAAVAAANRSAILEFEVADVPAISELAIKEQIEVVMPATRMPWGNLSLLLRDPDGNLVNIFSRPAA
ncbi:Glyoxalase-like domain-containing protein [Duganella sacchari]|uniref:Glyoxalase-like domain-containing protein n=1 Tax=Duganella sacchari TaxID=551987 RepID=A0A1M7NUB1_9BURK|nr:VOC family protein [Duganella sacchari]SHN07622.1 Glyoxalase-like domain-containing protein [Duganella sacchari]